MYKVDQLYNKESERGIRYDPTLAIDWQLSQEVIVSEKDLILPSFNEMDWEFLKSLKFRFKVVGIEG
jgi:dTDP-4-dehydrorhamnose 3,5-epimerase